MRWHLFQGFNCKKLNISFFVLCRFLSLVYCQEPIWFTESKNISVRAQDAVIMTLNKQLPVPVRLTTRSINGESDWNNIDQLLNEAETIIFDLQTDRDDWKEKVINLEVMNHELQDSMEKERHLRNFWMGTGITAVIALTVTICLVNFK